MTIPPLLRTAAGLLVLGGAVWGVLASGEGLRAPPPLATTWAVRERAGCFGDTLTLVQSGVYLHAAGADGRRVRGKLDDDRLAVTVECDGGRAWLSGAWSTDAMTATVKEPGCGCEGTLRAEARP